MKRVIAVFLILATLFPALFLSASAADPAGYVFEKQDIALYADFLPLNGNLYFCDEYIPEGIYKVDIVLIDSLISVGASVSFVVSTIYVHYVDNILDNTSYLCCPITMECIFSLNGGTDSAVLNSYLIDVGQGYTALLLPENYASMVRRFVLTPCFSVDSQLGSFIGDVGRGMFELSGTNLITIILVALGIVVSPVLLWFGYRYVKRKVVVSFRKGKV